MAYETLQFEIQDGVAHITLDRPDAANALNLTMGKELLDVAIRCDEDPGIRAALLSGKGKMFCAGGDLKVFAEAGDGLPAMLKELTVYLHGAISHFARMDPPLVTAVGGIAAGAGFSIACMGDLVLAAESARFTLAYTRAGLSPDGSSTWFLPRLVGMRRAQELALTNRMLSAAEAYEMNLITRVIPDDDLKSEAIKLATELAAGPTRTLGATKRLLLSSTTESLETQMELEARAIAEASGSADGQEGIAAFLAKRKPNFEGR